MVGTKQLRSILPLLNSWTSSAKSVSVPPLMKKYSTKFAALLAAGSFFLIQAAYAQMSTSPATEAEIEAAYATAIEIRTTDILKLLNLTDSDKSNTVYDVIVSQYHALRVRDAAIDTQLKVDGKAVTYANRASLLAAESKTLHDQFLANLSKVLAPEQIEQIKNQMTYNKVKVTYDAYCEIVPGLTDADKAKIMELLKQAREEAMDGGNAPEKSYIFGQYKDQINTYLDAHGHDVAKSTQEWEAKQELAKKMAEPAK
jgi:hypothetical protein